ncbi:MAG TPA: glycosyltransferase [Solirubrobacteraceae bacterium]|nr:glycosyltransferase [Solirubrobacteraceae bacterium]HLM86979.1 glycosyltransferase [Solirubrobacteraceae bacterium]
MAIRDARAVDVLIVSLGSTEGLRRADEELHKSLVRAGARVAIARARAPAPTRTLMLTDLAWALAARRAAERALRELPSPPRAIVYSSTTAALLWPRVGAIRFDATAAGNRPGRHGLWQRPLERRRLGEAPLLLPWSEGALAEAPQAARKGDRALVLPVPVEPSGPPEAVRDIAAITYAANPVKKGLDRVLAAWRSVRSGLVSEGAIDTAAALVVAGTSARELELAGFGIAGEQGVRVVGALPAREYRALVRRARVFVCAPRREDYGIAQLEALADGCLLVTTPAPGPYAALPIARELDARLVGEDLVAALRAALVDPAVDHAVRAGRALAPFGRAAVDRVVAERLLARLLSRSSG